MDHENEGMLRRREAAALLGLSVDTVDRLIRDGQLGAVRVRHAVLIPRQDVAALVKRRAGMPRPPSARTCSRCKRRVGPWLVIGGLWVCARCEYERERASCADTGGAEPLA
jgi:excisionase family DNA binding protein